MLNLRIDTPANNHDVGPNYGDLWGSVRLQELFCRPKCKQNVLKRAM